MRLHLASFVALVLAVPLLAAERPNVVLIISDDQRWTDFGFMGHADIKTPHLDKLASQSAVFPNGYVPTSLCRASLATLLTGLYSHDHKICCNDPPDGVDRTLMHPFIKNAPSLPRLLALAGYRSLQTGKFWEGHFSNAGFTHGMTTKGRHGEEGLAIGRKTMQPIYDFIEADPAKPFFVWYAPMMPHMPHNPPERLLKKYEVGGRNTNVAKYFAMCDWFDETCGELLDYLDQKKLADNTIVVFVVDNGWVQLEQAGGARGGPRGKLSPYDGGLRTPVMVRWPGHVKPGRHADLVSTVDVVPTILRACGVAPPKAMPGLNLLDIAKGPLPRKAVFGEIFVHTAKDLDKPAVNLTHRWARQGDWKLIRFEEGKPQAELFNLAQDPHEKNDLAGKEPERVQALTKLLDEWWKGKE